MLRPFPSQALIRRELLVSLRRVRLFVFAALIVLVCMAGVRIIWPNAGIDGVTSATPGRAANASAIMLDVVSMVLMAACGLFLPALAAVAISSERDQDTYDLLHLSLITPLGMAFGKLVNALGVYMLLGLSLLPVVGVTFFIVGVSWQDLVVQVAFLALLAVATASVGLYSSARFRHTAVSIAIAYIGAAFAFGIPYIFLFIFLQEFLGIRLPRLTGPQDLLTPMLVAPLNAFRSIPFRHSFAQALGGAMYLSLFSAFFIWRAVRALGRPPRVREVRQEKPIDDMQVLEARRKRFPYYLIDPLKRKKTIEDGRNPVLVRELRWGVLGRMTVMVRVFYVALAIDWMIALAFLLANVGDYSGTDGAIFAMTGLIACTCLAAPVLLSNLLAKEREQNNLEMLRMTLVRPHQILTGKLGAALIHLAPLMAAATITAVIVLGSLGIVCGEILCIVLMVMGLITLAVCLWVVVAVSLTVSLLARRAASALIGSYAAGLMVLLGISLTTWYVLMACWYSPYRALIAGYLLSSSEDLFLTACTLSPLMAYLSLLEGEEALAGWISSCLAFTLFGAILFLFCLKLFNRRLARNKA